MIYDEFRLQPRRPAPGPLSKICSCKFFVKFLQIFPLFWQVFPKIPLAVLCDIKGLLGEKALFFDCKFFGRPAHGLKSLENWQNRYFGVWVC